MKQGMATHCSLLAWRTPWAEEPGRLQSMGSQRIRHDREAKHRAQIVNALSFASSLRCLPGVLLLLFGFSFSFSQSFKVGTILNS